jgi:hypothetical protein
MVVTLNKSAFDHAKKLIEEGHVELDERDEWGEHRPSAEEENEFIREHGIDEYAKWYLGIDEEEDEDTKERYKLPYGDFENVHRCGVIFAESRAGHYKHQDIENAAAHLHGTLDKIMTRSKSATR